MSELYIYERCKVILKALNKELGETKQFYMEILNEVEVRLLQSDKRRIHLKLSKKTKENTKMIGNRVRRLTYKTLNSDRGIINNFLRLDFVTAKSFFHNFRDNYLCRIFRQCSFYLIFKGNLLILVRP